MKKPRNTHDIPQGKWFPAKGDRVFVVSFNCMGVVIEICPLLSPKKVKAVEIYYFVELEDGPPDIRTRSLFTADQLISSQWITELPQGVSV